MKNFIFSVSLAIWLYKLGSIILDVRNAFSHMGWV